MSNQEQMQSIQLMENRTNAILKHRLRKLGYKYEYDIHSVIKTNCPSDILSREHAIAIEQITNEYSKEI